MPVTCVRCNTTGEAPAPHRIGFTGPAKDRILASVCAPCWKEWEGVEVKVINEYRLNFMEPEHREMLKRACMDYFKLPTE